MWFGSAFSFWFQLHRQQFSDTFGTVVFGTAATSQPLPPCLTLPCLSLPHISTFFALLFLPQLLSSTDLWGYFMYVLIVSLLPALSWTLDKLYKYKHFWGFCHCHKDTLGQEQSDRSWYLIFMKTNIRNLSNKYQKPVTWDPGCQCNFIFLY